MRILLFIFLIVGLLSCDRKPDDVTSDLINFPESADGSAEGKLPEIVFQDTLFDFGKISEGELVQHTFIFENTGEVPLLLSRVEPSCGCTASKSWPKKPIAPGETGEIEIEFNSDKRNGVQNKSISVIANTRPATSVLYLKGEVLGPDSQSDK